MTRDRLKRFLYGSPGWSDYLFRAPPKQPDARTVYLGGAGLITAFRGAQTIWGAQPTAWVFVELGKVFVAVWGIIWMLVGIAVVAVATTGHRHPDWDRFAGFIMMMLWWVWGALYLISGIFAVDPERRSIDLFAGLGLVLTGLVLSAGIIQGIRKTQEIQLREIAVKRIRQLEGQLKEITAENQHLRGQVKKL